MLNKFVRNSRNLFIVGALLAIAAFGLAFTVLSKAQQAPQSLAATAAVPTPPPAADVLVVSATQDLPAFTQIADLKTAQQYFKAVPYSHFKTLQPDYVKGFDGIAALLTPTGGGPRRVSFALPKNTPLLASELLTSTIAGTIDYSPMIGHDEVAQAVLVQPTSAGNGNIQPGDHVDVLLGLKFDVTKDSAARQSFFTGNGTTIDATTPRDKVLGNVWEEQTTIQNVHVLSVTGANYTLGLSHQNALLVKWIKDMNGSVELVVRAATDSDKGGKPFDTTPVLPNYLVNGLHNKFKLP